MASRNTPGTSGSNLTKQERREQAREKARQLQQAEKRRAKRNRLFIVLGSLVVVALVATAVYVIVRSGQDKAREGETFTHAENKITAQRPKNVNEWAGIPLGKGADGKLTAGVTNEGKPTVTIYYDYLCHVCNDLNKQSGKKLADMAGKGEITLVYNPLSIIGGAFSAKASQADFYIASTAPDKYLAFHEKVFSDISTPVFESKKLPEGEEAIDKIVQVGRDVGLTEEQVGELKNTLASDSYATLTSQADQQFGSEGFTGTPAVLVDNKKIVDWTGNKIFDAISDAK